MFKNMKIGMRLVGGFAMVVIILVSVIGIGYTNLSRYAEKSGWNTHTFQVLEEVNGILGSLVNIETGQRGFLVAGKDEFLEPLNIGKQSFTTHFDKAKELTSDNPEQQLRLEKLQSAYDVWIKEAVESSINERRAVGKDLTQYGKVIAIVSSGKTGMDAMRTMLANIDRIERDLLKTRSEEMNSMYAVTQASLMLGGIGGTILASVLAFWITRSITRPLNEVVNIIKRMAAGDLTTKIAVASNDEVGQLQAAMNIMQVNLTQIIAEIKNMVEAANCGDFSTKMDMTDKQGYGEEVSQLLNQLSDTVDTAFNDIVRVSTALAQGDLSQKITRDYQGAFNQVKQAVNTTADSLAGIVEEIRSIVALANKGDFSTRMKLDGKQGYAKELSELLNQLSDTVDTVFSDTIFIAQALEEGDLTQSLSREYQGAFDQVKQGLNNTIAKLSQTIGEVIAAADQLGNASEQISATSQSLSQASNEQAASVEETTASIEEMSASIQQNSENAKITDGMASKAANEASQGGVAVKQTVKAMKDIAGKIGIIDDIAYQTNMLALNAAIEAARAGEHGKGFAVVAAEVRKLAERSQIAAKEIGELAQSSVKTAEDAGQLLNAIVPSISKTSDLVQEIAAASQEQSAGAEQVNTAMMQMTTLTQQNASASEELAATAEEMTGQAEQLQTLMSFFKITGGNSEAKMTELTHHAKPVKPVVSPTRSGKTEFNMNQFERF
jgi:methyl-accepting chemotaxis protein